MENRDPEIDFHKLREATKAGLVGRPLSGLSVIWGITVVVLVMWLVDPSRNGLLAIWIALTTCSAIWTLLRVVSWSRLPRQRHNARTPSSR